MPAPQLRRQGLNASFQHRLLLSLSERRRRGGHRQQGFTLVELMIVVAIVGILAAVALPSYLKARDAAKIGARIGEAAAFAKECGVYKATEIGKPTFTGSGTATDGVAIAGCDAVPGNGTLTAKWGAARAEGVKCLDKTTTDETSTATITVSNSSSSAQITCTLS